MRQKRAGTPYDITSLKRIISSGVMWSSEVKQGLLAHHDMMLMDTMGSTEGGMASNVSTRASAAQTAKFQLSEGVRVFTDDGRVIAAGSGEVGKIGLSGQVPIGYYKDPKKSAETFREIDGVRYSFPGDFARVEADGTITLLGRGSMCINSAGEKVYPEEVEEVVKRHEAIYDCLVVGVPDDRFGERVVAVASLREGAAGRSDDADGIHARTSGELQGAASRRAGRTGAPRAQRQSRLQVGQGDGARGAANRRHERHARSAA